MCKVSAAFTERINLSRNEVYGVTKLRNEIYILCHSFPHVICVFEDRLPFRLQKEIKIKEIKEPIDIRSSENDNCLYIADHARKCLWKIIMEIGDVHKIVKWLVLDYKPTSLSMSSDGHVLVFSHAWSILKIYGSNAELLRSITLPRDIKKSIHAVEIPTGNFIILHWWMDEKAAEDGRNGDWLTVISEVSRDGQMVVRRFIPSNEAHELNAPEYLSLDSDDGVFVADRGNNRVILLDSDLKWNQIICPTNEENGSISLSIS